MGTLAAPLLQELIDHLDVFETGGRGKHRTQRAVIYYRFVGYIDLSDAAFAEDLLSQENHRAATRQGVAVDYLPKSPSRSVLRRKSPREKKRTSCPKERQAVKQQNAECS